MEISEAAGSASSNIASLFTQPFHSIISPKSFPAAESRSTSSISPFTQSSQVDGGDVVDYLSCIAYFEVKIDSNLEGNFIFCKLNLTLNMRIFIIYFFRLNICRTRELSIS